MQGINDLKDIGENQPNLYVPLFDDHFIEFFEKHSNHHIKHIIHSINNQMINVEKRKKAKDELEQAEDHQNGWLKKLLDPSMKESAEILKSYQEITNLKYDLELIDEMMHLTA
eukprot:CAMPEP_0117421516 /NCGR_PEP_ID=MMETSP0758-20121206/2580_1 /TAXON_ID=63605 /ORGANISM="Percolomonas cosmopolitus, Strain AE-1 (ATCC 50343)" /LENGTH=112 /DNA_ID=CAMNT_0005203663 /DNA_START=681 /DNA_END=1019 /DNA_ORIENTATION=+